MKDSMATTVENSATETLRRKRADKVIGLTALSYLVIGLVLAYTTPADMLDRHLWARTFVDFMSFIPYVEKVGLVSPIPQIAQFFAAVMWALTPIAFVPIIRALVIPRPKRASVNYLYTIKVIGVALLFWAVILKKFFTFAETRFIRIETSTSFGLGVLGSLSIFAVPLVLAAILVLCRGWKGVLYGGK